MHAARQPRSWLIFDVGQKMKIASTFAFLLLAVMAQCCGCASNGRPNPRPLSVSVSITPIGASSLSTEQVVRVHEAIKPQLLQSGYTFAVSSSAADLVLLVSFTPIPGGNGGHVRITGIEPTAQFRRETDGGDTPEAKEMRRRQRELEQWIERQGRSSDS